MLRLKQKIRKMNKTFFIFSSIPKVKHYCLFHENTKYNINRFVLQCEGDFTWRVSDCEELVGGFTGDDGVGIWRYLIIILSS